MLKAAEKEPWTATELKPPGAAAGDQRGFPSAATRPAQARVELLGAGGTSLQPTEPVPDRRRRHAVSSMQGSEGFSSVKPRKVQFLNIVSPRSERMRK